MHASGRQRSATWLLLLAAAVLLRATIPVGYMPGNLLAGEFVRLCPVGLPADALGGHHAGHGGDTASESDGSCPAGFAPQAAALIDGSGNPASPAPLRRQVMPPSVPRPATAARTGLQARAPPRPVPALV